MLELFNVYIIIRYLGSYGNNWPFKELFMGYNLSVVDSMRTFSMCARALNNLLLINMILKLRVHPLLSINKYQKVLHFLLISYYYTKSIDYKSICLN